MKKLSTLLLIVAIFICQYSFGQYYYFSHVNAGENPGGLNNDIENLGPSGWRSILRTQNDSTWSDIQTIPFDFTFNGDTVSEYIVAHSGVLTFSTSTTAIPTTANTSIPSKEIPDSSICIWGLDNSGTNDVVYKKTFGRAPNRQHWVMFNSYSAPGATGSNWTYWSIVLEETSNKIYLVDMRTSLTPLSLTLGVQIDTNNAFQVFGSPNISNLSGNVSDPSDNTFYEFIQGTQEDNDLTAKEVATLPVFPSVSDTAIMIEGTFENVGALAVSSFDFNYQINGGTVYTSSHQSTILSGASISITHDVAFNPSIAGQSTIEIWASNVNGQADENMANDTLSMALNISDSIPNRIDSILPVYKIEVISKVSDGLNVPTDLDFHPDLARKELWVINRRIRSLGGATVTYHNVGEANQTSEFKVDGNAWHFMALPSGIAFSNNGNFANSASIFNANTASGYGGSAFTGPALWSSDPEIYARFAGPGTNGSHLDMLHESPYTMGIAHETDNTFWVYDGNSGDVVRYDFADDHGPGNDDHSDGKLRRYPVPVSRIVNSAEQEVPCHLILDKKTNWLYIADQKAAKIYRLDITSGVSRGPGSGNFIFQQTEPLAEYLSMTNITYETFIDSGISQPSGIELVNNRLLVSDYATGDIFVYDISSDQPKMINKFETGHAGVAGIKVGPDGNVWFVNPKRDELSRIIAAPTSLQEYQASESDFSLFPNPTNGMLTLNIASTSLGDVDLVITNTIGQTVWQQSVLSNQINLDLSNLENGIYFATLFSENQRITKKIIVNK